MAISKQDIIKTLDTMKVGEIKELVTMIEAHFGVKAEVAAGGGQVAAAPTPTELNVVLEEVGASKIAVIKLVAKVTGKGLMEAKKMLDKLPVIIKEKVKPEEAEELISEFKTAGASAIGK